jgi:hypothetical protein
MVRLGMNKNNYTTEIPNSDAHRIFKTLTEVGEFFAEHGIMACQTLKVNGIITVPAWAEGRKAYIAAKIQHCNRYGSN